MTIRGVVFWPMLVDPTFCGGDNIHAETIRIDGEIHDLLIEKCTFVDDREENTSTIFVTEFRSEFFGLSNMTNIKFRNNYFGDGATAAFQIGGGNPSGATGACAMTFEYNTFNNGIVWNNCALAGQGSGSGVIFTGNAGTWTGGTPCVSGSHTKNFWRGSSVGCGTDSSATNLLLGGTFGYEVQSGSPLIDAGEATCASTANGEDILSASRPSGSACDAGAHEFGGGGGGSPSVGGAKARGAIIRGVKVR
jgi:hypothetical protein